MRKLIILMLFFMGCSLFAQPVDDDIPQGLPQPVINDKPPAIAMIAANTDLNTITFSIPTQSAIKPIVLAIKED